MPTAMENALRKVADKYAKRGKLKSNGKYKTLKERKDAFVYGTMRKHGWKPGMGKSIA